jgi:L-aspartate oxidase
MSRDAGVLRSPAGLERLTRTLNEVPPAAGNSATPAGGNGAAPVGRKGLDLATVEATSLHTASALVVASALARAESRGCHRWRDIPPAGSDGSGRHTVLRVEEGRVRVACPVRSMEIEEVGA